jgi:hypothetical protein
VTIDLINIFYSPAIIGIDQIDVLLAISAYLFLDVLDSSLWRLGRKLAAFQ